MLFVPFLCFSLKILARLDPQIRLSHSAANVLKALLVHFANIISMNVNHRHAFMEFV